MAFFFAKGQDPLYFVSSDRFFCESMTYLVLALSGKRPGQTVNKCWLFAECGKRPKKSRFEEVLTTNENKLPLQYPYSFFKSDVFVFSCSYLIYTSRKKASFSFIPFFDAFCASRKEYLRNRSSFVQVVGCASGLILNYISTSYFEQLSCKSVIWMSLQRTLFFENFLTLCFNHFSLVDFWAIIAFCSSL